MKLGTKQRGEVFFLLGAMRCCSRSQRLDKTKLLARAPDSCR
jgi:hypothetical protein